MHYIDAHGPVNFCSRDSLQIHDRQRVHASGVQQTVVIMTSSGSTQYVVECLRCSTLTSLPMHPLPSFLVPPPVRDVCIVCARMRQQGEPVEKAGVAELNESNFWLSRLVGGACSCACMCRCASWKIMRARLALPICKCPVAVASLLALAATIFYAPS